MSLIALLAIPGVGIAAASSDQSLKGIKQVHVLVEKIVNPPERLTEDQVRTDVELKLRTAGVTVLPDGSGDLTAYVYVRIGTDRVSGVFTVDVELKQLTRLERDPSSGLYYAATWNTGSFGLLHSAREIRDALADQIDVFVNAWLAANPK